ncbi:hypothetical protein N7519_010274 [Penicillium mononematosum]|uniref:uncharacterized protein n=1 Tax=Penicillium mononematosum TaxID=268346 RepID=UPI00254856DD|nr:uncharacterized protein N7519_010274 [Penicillium mononematosum]KAJ6179813.1 hypothetical protein N7519_010274 [Penicillium mononematosum]
MAPLEFHTTTLINETENLELKDYSAKIEEFFVYDIDEGAENCYTLKSEVVLSPKSLARIVEDSNGLSLKYRFHGSEEDEQTKLEKISGGHQVHQEVRTNPLQANTALHHYCGIADNDAEDAETMLNVGNAPELSSSKDLFWEMVNGQPKTDVNGQTAKAGPGPAPVSGTSPQGAANVVMLSGQALNNPRFAPATLKGYKDMMSILSLFMLLASFALEEASRKLGRKISPTQDTPLYTQTIADAYLKAPFDKTLRGILICSAAGGNSIEKTIPRDQVHRDFLSEFAEDFKIDEDAYKTLDKMLTEFTRSVARGNVQGSQKVNFAIARPWIPIERIPGSGFSMVIPRIKIYYISASSRSFTEIVGAGKNRSSEEKVKLEFQYTAQICDLNEDVWDCQKAKIDNGFRYMTGKSFDEVRDSTGQTVII